MLTVARTFDMDLLKSLLLRYPAIWDAITDDFSAPVEEYLPVDNEGFWYVLAMEDGEPFGWFAFFPENAVSYVLHTVMPLNAGARRALGMAIEWMFEQVPQLSRVVTMVPSYNAIAQRFAVRAGLRQYGRNPKSFQKGGKLCDQLLYGVSRTEA